MNDIATAGKAAGTFHPALETADREMHSILQKESFKSIARILCETTGKLIGAGTGYTVLINPAGGKPEISVWDPSSQNYTLRSSLPPCIADLSRNINNLSKPFYRNNIPGSGEKEGASSGGGASARNLMTIPLIMNGCSLGFIGLTDKPGGFTDEDVSKAEDLSRLAAVAIARNISLEMLISREKQYRDLFEYAGEPIAVNDMRGILLDVNRKTCETLGYSKSELLGKNIRSILHPESLAGIAARLEEARAKGEFVFEAACLCKDGARLDMELSSRIFDYYGTKTILTLAKDISERKRSAEAAVRDKERLESLWKIYKYQTEGIKELLDYLLEESLRLTASQTGKVYLHYYDAKKKDFFLEVWGKDPEKKGRIITTPPAPAPRKTGIWGEALASRKPVLRNTEDPVTQGAAAPAGRETPVRGCMAIPVLTAEQNAAVIELTRKESPYTDTDAHQLTMLVDSVLELAKGRNAEKEVAKNRCILNAILNSTPDAITAKDISGHYITLNPGAAAIMHKKAAEVMGRTDSELFPQDAVKKNRESDKRILANRKIETCEEETGIGGRKQTLLVTRGPLFDEKGKVMGVFSMARDITERKQLETELLNVQKIESLGVMAGGIAHDFNNMLTAVLGNTSLALENVPPRSQLFRLLTNALKASRAAQELTHQLQTFAKGNETADKHILNLPGLIKEAAALAGSGARTKLVFDFNQGTPPVKGNEGQLKQVINNLVLNALQAMPRGGVITIKTAPVTIQERISPNLHPGAYARITVTDTGSGIPRNATGKIFDPYFSTKKSGRGLGLSMVYSIIKRHGGHIGVVSKEGEGTIFCIYLPAAGRGIVREHKAQKPLKMGKGRILVMDDDKFVLEVLTLMLRRLGYTTQTAGDGRAAIAAYTRAAAAKRPFGAVIMDLTIPGGMGGDEAAKRLRAIDPNVKLVLSSGYSNNSVMANCAQHTFDTVLPKPYRIQEVGEIMAGLLGGKKQKNKTEKGKDAGR